jgi:topoisomerase-4 subunit A
MGLRQVLSEWVTFPDRGAGRRSNIRLAKIADRMELLDGYLIAYLNLDRVIEIIRTEDEPKPIMMAEFGLTDRQAEAILNMRLRSLRRLEEMELRGEREKLEKERDGRSRLVADKGLQQRPPEKGSGRPDEALRPADRARAAAAP